jgi:hypothetical protein
VPLTGLHIDAFAITCDPATWTQALATGTTLSGSTSRAAFTAICTVVEHVDTTVATIGEPCAADTLSVTATFGGTTHVATRATMSRVVHQADAVAVVTNRRVARAIVDALVTHAKLLAAILAAPATVVVIGAQVDANTAAQAGARWTPARARDALLAVTTNDTAIATIIHVTGDAHTGRTAQRLTRAAVATPFATLRTVGTSVSASAAVLGVTGVVYAIAGTQRERALTTATSTPANRAVCTTRAAATAVRLIDSKVGAGLSAALGTQCVVDAR